MNRFLKKSVCIGIYAICTLSFSMTYAEGTKQLSPIVSSGDTSIVMLHTNSDSTGNFAEYNGTVVSRLNLRIEDFTSDTVYIGLSREYDDFGNPDGIGGVGTYCFRIKDPNGNVVHSSLGNSGFSINSGNANADSWELAMRGPDVLDPLGYSTDTLLYPYAMFIPNMNGDFYIEITDNATDCATANPGNQVNLKYYDFTVVSGGAEQPGRLWSLNWAFVSPSINPNTPPECQFDRPFNGTLYSYTDDGFVSKIDFDSSGFQGLQFTVAFGKRGPSNLGNVILDRMSVNNADSTAGAADHMVFINDPDNTEFPSSTNVCGDVVLFGVQCEADTFCFSVGITQPGQVEIILDFTGDGEFTPDTTDVIIAVILDFADTVCIGWNGLKGDGSTLSFGESLPAIVRYSQGVQHYAAYDVELLKYGFCVETVRPICPGIATNLLYWDDSNISDDVNTPLYDESDPGTGQPRVQLNGCGCGSMGCRTWTNVHVDGDTSCIGQITGYGDRSTLNTWWFASTTILGPLELPFVAVMITGDSMICAGQSTEFTAVGTPDTVDFVYEWLGPNGFMANTESTGMISNPGVYYVTITDTIANCQASDSATLGVFDLPVLSLDFVCLGANQQNADVDLTVVGDDPFSYNWSTGDTTQDLFNVPPGNYIVTVTDANGCQAIDSILVEGCCVLDIVCPPMDGGQFTCFTDIPAPVSTVITMIDYCDPVNVTSVDVSNGATGCGTDTIVVTRTYSVTDGAGSTASCVQVFKVIDNVPPTITCPADITVTNNCGDIDPMITGFPVVSDNCTESQNLITGMMDSGPPGDCLADGPVLRTWMVFDECGNTANCVQQIWVDNTNAPVVISCPSDTTVDCGTMHALPLPVYADDCTPVGDIIITSTDDSLGFDGSCLNGLIGVITRTYSAADVCGNVNTSCVVIISLQDTIAPALISCPGDTTVQCSAPAGTLGMPVYSDNCTEVTVSFQDDTIGFMPPNLGMIIRTFYGTDACGNVDSSCVQTISILDTLPPTCLTQDITVFLDGGGSATIANDAVDNGSDDACGLASISVSPNGFNCGDVGDNIVTQTVTDLNGNSTTCTATVTVLDTTAPVCATLDITVQLDGAGAASIADDAVDNGSNDACGIASITLSQTDFDCTDVGDVIVTQTVTDVNGNVSSCTATVTVEDNVAPECLTQDITVQLDVDGNATISDDAVDNGSNDACGIGSITLSQTVFDCGDVGALVVTQTVADDNGNVTSCTATITVEDNIAPECLTHDITVQLDAMGLGTISDDAVDNGSSDACGIASITVSQTDFDCNDLGVVLVTQTVTDVNGNTSTCSANVTVEDNIAPECFTLDITVFLDVDGNATIADGDLDNGSTDNCGVASITLSQTAFSCADVGVVIVTQTVADDTGNTSTCTASVTVEDNVAPECIAQDITVQLDANGNATIADDALDNGSNDACGIASITVSQTDFDCEDLGIVIVTQTVTDNNGNTSTCSANVTVEDNIEPTIACPANVTVSCAADVPAANTGDVISSDNCSVAIEILHVGDVISNQTCANRYTVTRTYQATDESGNTSVCAQIITVNDITPPTIVCPPDMTITMPIEYDPGIAGIPTFSDNCAGMVASDFADVIIPGECEEQFVVERTWTATDVCGNSASCLQIITIDNDCGCDLTCPPDITVNLDPGACEIVISYPDPMFEGGGCPMEIMVPVNLTQNTNTTLIQDALACTGTGDSHWRAYDLAAMGVTENFQMNSLGMLSWSAGTIQVFVYSYTGPMPPAATLDPGQMTLLGQSAPSAVGAFTGTTINLSAPVVIPPGTNIAVEQRVISAPGIYTVAGNYAGNSQPAYIQAAPCGAPTPTSYPAIGFGQIHPVQVLNGNLIQVGAILVQTSGLPSGSAFPIGTTTNCFQLIDGATGEAVDSCCFDVVVNEYPFSIPPACNDLVQISVDQNCEAQICADVILEGGPYGCYDDYIVITDEYGPDSNVNCVSLPYSPGLHYVTITDPELGISCWGTFLIEDKLPPTIECQDYTLSCGQDLSPVFTPPIQGVNTCATILNPGLPIGPDAGVITTSTCTVSLPPGVEIVDVNVCVKITHTWIGDCNTDIISPAGVVTNLWGFGQCGSTQNMHQKFDDSGPTTVLCADINNGCDFILQPVAFQLGTPTLAQYNTENPNGTWTLMITDNAGGDGGTLDEWYLEIEYAQNAPFAPIADDNCDDDLTLVYTDEESGDLCGNVIITRTWTATDDAGNTAQCVQTLTVEPLTLATLECPENYIGTCGQSSDPDVTGWPTIDGVEVTEGGMCNIFVGYWDQELADCGNGTKIIRRWNILDWCTQELEECLQIIKLADDQAPVLTCPPDQTVSTDPWFCNADVNLLLPEAYDLCGTPFTLSVSVSDGTLHHFGGNNYRVDDLPLGTHTVTWTAEDACGNESSCSYDITVEDQIPPVPICDEHTVVSLTTDDPLNEGLTKIYATTFDDGSYDNCGPVTFLVRRMDSCIDFDWIGPNGEYPNNDGGLPESLDKGLTFQPWAPFACCDVGNTVMVELRVTDLAGNINSCMVEVYVQDKLPPFIECPPDITLSCEFWFDGHETSGFQPTDGLEGIFGRVLDGYDYAESDRQNIIINDPGNDELIQPHNWGLDGWSNDNCDVNIDIRTRIFNDCTGDNLPTGAPQDAVRLVERTFRAQDQQGNTSTCRQRVWVVDFDPFFITDQVCGLNNADDVRWPCDLDLTNCPEDLTPEGLSAYAPNNRPIVNDDNCSVIGVSYDDQIFHFIDGLCLKIVRTWTVIDWCQFDPVEHTGYWQYVQIIKVNDHVGPLFVDCPTEPVTLCVEDEGVTLPPNNQVFLGEEDLNSSACSVHLLLTHEVREFCSDEVIYDVKIYPYNGTEYVQIVSPTHVGVDSNNLAVLTLNTRQNSLPSNHPFRKYGLPYNDKYCSNYPLPGGTKDYHRVLWSVEDGCGNLQTCAYLLRLEDCKQPTPVCVGLSSVVMPIGGEVTIWAKDFDQSSYDDCTAHEDLLFSFSGTTYEPFHVYDCAGIEANGSPSFLVEIWAADEGNDQNCDGVISWNERNKDYCTTYIVIDDNEEVCDGGVGIGGVVLTEETEAVEKVTVQLTDQSGHLMSTFVTDKDGKYRFTNPLLTYIVEPQRNDDHKNGVSTLDLVEIQKHLLGLKPLTSPYKMIAADANNSQTVTAIDLVEIRKLILGLYVEYPNNTSWRFVDANFEFNDPASPWPFDESIELESGMSLNGDFIAIKVGDINGTVAANAGQITNRGARQVLDLAIEDREVKRGELLELPVYGENFEAIVGYQLTMETKGLNYTGVDAGAINMPSEFVAPHDGAITMSWANLAAFAEPASAKRADALFTLHFTATEDGKLSNMLKVTSDITEAEAYRNLVAFGEPASVEDDVELLDISLHFVKQGAGEQLDDYALYQNEPNPFADQTLIGFDLPAAMSATLVIYDVHGRVVHKVEGQYHEGYNEIIVKGKELKAGGAYYYRLNAGDFTASKKFVLSRE